MNQRIDRLIKHFDAERDGDLMLCEHRGVAYQADMQAGRVRYDDAYLAKVDAYDGTPIAQAVNAGRCALIAKYLPAGTELFDHGAGSGAFIRAARAAGFVARGRDVMLAANIRLQLAALFSEFPAEYRAFTMWDTLEHMENPEPLGVQKGSFLFASVPIFEDLRRIRESKHYRPGEHLYYWTAEGFIGWMEAYGFRLLEQSDHEVVAGRESIGAFAFCRDLPDYHDHIAAYKELHSTRHYGDSATEEYLELSAKIIAAQKPVTILDYGCGRSDLAAHFWNEGRRRIERYDPAIGKYKRMPIGQFDFVFCCDVMEHIPLAYVDQILGEVRSKSSVALITISTKLARAKLPDGRNAHVTLLTKSEWVRWVEAVFGEVRVIPSRWEHELILLTNATNFAVPEVPRCGCGGEMWKDTFNHPRRPVEWVLRCRDCGRVESVPEKDAA